MTVTEPAGPISVPPRWNDLVTLPLDATLAAGPDGHDGATLRIGRAVEMAVELTNRSHHELRLVPSDAAPQLRVGFRPHTLLDHHAVTVDDVSAAEGWTLLAEPVEGNGLRQVLALRCDRAVALAPGETCAVRLAGLAADGFGGSRATHANVEYSGVTVADADALALTDRILLPLSILHDAPAASGGERSGSNAATEAISARLGTSDSVIADGATRSMLLLYLHNRTGADIDLRTDGEALPRISLGTEPAGSLASSLLGSGRMAISTEADHLPAGWAVLAPDDLALEPAVPGSWVAGTDLAFWVEVVTDAPPGTMPLHVRYENLPGVDPGVLTLLVRVGFTQTTVWTTDLVRPVRLWGHDNALELWTGDLNVSGELGARLSVSHHEADLGHVTLQAPRGLTIDSPATTLRTGRLIVGNVTVDQRSIRIGRWTLSENPETGGLEFARGLSKVLRLRSASGHPVLEMQGIGKSHWRIAAEDERFFVLYGEPDASGGNTYYTRMVLHRDDEANLS